MKSQPSQPASQPAGQPASQPANQPASQPTSQPTSQPASHPATQPARIEIFRFPFLQTVVSKLKGSAAEAVACKSAAVLAPPPACIGSPPIEI